jgi:hypothetical protein
MADTTPDASSGPPVERLARSLLACARDQPSLLVRSREAPGEALPGLIEALPRLHVRRPGWLPGPFGRPNDRSPYLEELVSMAVATARQAEDAARHASDACAMARRGRFAWAGFGVLGIAIGISGLVDAHWTHGMNHLQAKMADEAHMPAEPPGKADNLPGPVVEAESPVTPALHAITDAPSPGTATAATVEAPLPAAIPIAVRPTWSIDPADAPPRNDIAPFYSPPPRVKYHTQRNHRANVTPHRPVVVTHFFAALRRDVRAIFR